MFRDPILSRPISKWKEYESFLLKQLRRLPPPEGENIPSLTCRKIHGFISYNDSEYGYLHHAVKRLYEGVTLRGHGPNPVEVFDFRGRAAIAEPLIIDVMFDMSWMYRPDEVRATYGPKVDRIYEQAAATPTRTALALSVVSSATDQRHAVALVCWITAAGERHVAVYDSMYYKRGDEGYTWAVRYAGLLFRDLGLTEKQIHNLSYYCYRKRGGEPDDIHCPQYVINAEFCMIYALYFFYEYAKLGFPHSAAGFKQVVEACYIVRPEELTRSLCTSNSMFRLRFISFLMTVITLMRRDAIGLGQVYQTVLAVSRGMSYRLLHPEIMDLVLAAQTPNTQRRIQERGRHLFYSEGEPTPVATEEYAGSPRASSPKGPKLPASESNRRSSSRKRSASNLPPYPPRRNTRRA